METKGKYTAGDWVCPTWKHVTPAIKIEEEKKTEMTRKEKKCKRRKVLSKKPEKYIGSCKKVKLFPNEKERQILTQWFGSNRWTYNQGMNEIVNFGVGPYKGEIREYCVN
jgi:hypothetical protein